MVKTATITFHGAYNFGSALQTYALQEFVTALGAQRGVPIDYSVLNYRTRVQKELYWQINRPRTKSNWIKRLMRLPYKKKLHMQAERFETFLRDHIHLTEEVDETGIGRYASGFDYYISGSDQIFNVRSHDFSYAYLLDFTESANKISYAASLGPLCIDWDSYDRDIYVTYLRQFASLSVREQRSKDMVDDLLGTQSSELHVDPTLLLSADAWRRVQSDRNYKNGQYILIYCLEPMPQHMQHARRLSQATGLPIVCTGYRCKYDYFNPFVKMYDAGPADFLSLIDHAAMVLTSSFHGTAFSVIYQKPFWVLDGMEDNRIRNLLMMTDLTGNNVPLGEVFDFAARTPLTAADTHAETALAAERKRSEEYLIRALGL